MRIYLMTDLEAPAGVLDFENWCTPKSRYNDLAKQLLTEEVNAAVDGFISEGATEILVADGHGSGGINPALLDPRAEVQRGWGPGPYPLGLDEGFDACAWVGQHAKSRTEYSHLTHTQSFSVLEMSVNGVAIGEFGQVVLCASQLGIPAIFAAGEKAFAREAEALVPGIETAWGKRGLTAGRGDECSVEEYTSRNTSAIHKAPQLSRDLIRQGAAHALRRVRDESFGLCDFNPPFEKTVILRQTDSDPRTYSKVTHPTDVIELMNRSGELKPVEDEQQLAELLCD